MLLLARWIRPTVLISALLVTSCNAVTSGIRFPKDRWLMYAAPKDGGFSPEKLRRAREYWESTESAAFMVVRDGIVVAAWGDVDRRFMLHSVRKSVINSLYGIHVDAGNIDLDKTLEQLGVDDINPSLNADEKQAKIVDLLRARSGVYHAAAAEPPGNPKPPRGSHLPGTHWDYNGWDFNALGTILEQEADITIFEEFKRRIADPLGMQDYRARDGHYEYAHDLSIHPSYPIRMSARDMARFGLLYLNEGAWDGERILSKEWVDTSTSVHSTTGSIHGAYGYLWWIADTEPFQELHMFSALGVGQQSIDVIPGAGLVVVLRTDTYAGARVSAQQRIQLIRMVLDAVTSNAAADPALVSLPEVPRAWTPARLSNEYQNGLCGNATLSLFGIADVEAHIALNQGELVLETPLGRFGMIAVSVDRFVLEDVHESLHIERNEDGSVRRIRTENELIVEGYRHLTAGDTEQAIAVFLKAVDYFPYSSNCYDSLGEAYMENGDESLAKRSYERSLELNPSNIRAQEILGKRPAADPASRSKLEAPETAAGRCADDFFEAFNSGDNESLRSFMVRYKTEAALEERSVDERVREVLSLRDQWRELDPIRFVRQTDHLAILLVRLPRTGEGLAFRFNMESGDPHRLGSIAVRGPAPLDAEDDAIIRLTDK